MTDQTLRILILLAPLLIGGIIAAINADEVNETTENAEAWTRKTQSSVSRKNGWFSRFIANPVLWLIVTFCDWTDGFEHRGLKNGTRVAVTLYLVAAWCFVLYAAFMLAVVLVVGGVVIYIVFKVLASSNSDSSFSQGFERGKRIMGAAGSGQRVNPETGRIQKQGLIGWIDTDERIDPETGNVQEKGFIGWKDTETRINQETGNLQHEGFLGYHDSDIRINPDTGIIQKKGLIGWIDTEERINPDSGKHQKKGLIGWIDD
ncbi:MAG: hypothetical protein M0Q53_19695 [Prolixibacteraceae bacterium]|jgi:hypothetical protein|nr:hypothetical protein [Prolixibacteraceae bacterium]